MAVDKLVDSTQLDNDLSLVADAIREKAGISDQLSFPSGFVDAVEGIKKGGIDLPDVVFYDSLANNGQGGIAYTYTASQFANLTAMPVNPNHSTYTSHGISIPMTSQGWNWSLADAKAYVAKYGRLNIGQTYRPTDNKSHYLCYFESNSPSETWKVEINLSTSGTITYQIDNETPISTSEGTLNITFLSAGWHEVKIDTGSAVCYPYRSFAGPIPTYIYEVYLGNMSKLGGYSFCNMTYITTITIPEGITSCDDNCFNNCYSLTSITFPSGFDSYGSSVLVNCYKIVNISFPGDVSTAGSGLIESCYSLKDITLPFIDNLQKYTVHGNYGLIDLVVPDTGEAYEYSIYYNCALKRITLGSIEQADNYFICNNYSLSEIILTENIDNYATYAIYYSDQYGVINIIFKDNITIIPNHICYYFSGISNVTMTNAVTTIGSSAFQGCYSLSSINLSSNLQTIGDYAFDYCCCLNSITLPNTLTTIGKYAFECTNITNLEIPNSVISIGQYTFQRCYNLKNVTLSNSLTLISAYLFCDCTNLSNVNIPYGVTAMNNGVFNSCKSLTEITIPSSVTSIGTNVFTNCSSLFKIVIEASTPPILSNVNAFTNLPADYKIIVPSGSRNTYIAATNWSSLSSHIEEAS